MRGGKFGRLKSWEAFRREKLPLTGGALRPQLVRFGGALRAQFVGFGGGLRALPCCSCRQIQDTGGKRLGATVQVVVVLLVVIVVVVVAVVVVVVVES